MISSRTMRRRRISTRGILVSCFGLLLAFQTLQLPSGALVRRLSSYNSSFYGGPSTCPAAIRNAKGIYRNNETMTGDDVLADSTFHNVVLLVSANHGYRHMLKLWRSLADKHDLQYAIVAMDRKLQSRLHKDRSKKANVVLASQHTATGASEFRNPLFNSISCNKMRVVLDILERCQTDVVFSDVDNIFLKDPFQGELGRLIMSGEYDYIYQHNDAEGSASCWSGDLAKEGNTGFYYLSHTASVVKKVIRETLRTCEQPDNKLDDQTLFWNAMRDIFKHRSYRHCDSYGKAINFLQPEDDKDEVTRLCCLDDTLYPIGLGFVNEETETFHANYLVGQQSKMKKLHEVMEELHLSQT